MKKAQITIFMLLGIVIAIIFGFLFYASHNLTEDVLEKKVNKIYNDFLKATSIKEHIQDCLGRSARDGISLAALQGGRIYNEQIGKNTKDPNLVIYLSFNKKEEVGPFTSVTEDYSWDNDGELHNVDWIFQGRFGGAYEVSGSNFLKSYINISNNESLNFGTAENFTIMLWVRTNSSEKQTILAKGTSYNLSIVDGIPLFFVSDGTNTINISADRCEIDCGQLTGPNCGDGNCDSLEDCANCRLDCGKCDSTCSPPDGYCTTPEDASTCSDCFGAGFVCGNEICEIAEDCGTCSRDCPCHICGDNYCVVPEYRSRGISDGLWHHIAVSFNRRDSLTLFVDGFIEDKEDATGITLISNDGELLIGTDNKSSTGHFFNGTIDEVSIYNRTLSEVEINLFYSNKRIITDPITVNDVVPYYLDPPGNFYYVSYGIKAPTSNINKFNLKVPFYPYNDSLVENPVIAFNDTILSYGQPDHFSLFAYYNLFFPTLHQLCNGYGPNYFGYLDAQYSCETYSLVNDSIQTMLREYIINKTKEYTNFSHFTKNYKYNITRGDLTGDILFGEDHISVFIIYPIVITLEGKPPITKFLDFNYRLNIRFKKIHELAKHIIGHKYGGSPSVPEADADNVFFNITDDPWDCDCENPANKSTCFPCKPMNVVIEKEGNYCSKGWLQCTELDDHYRHSHILKITDYDSIIDGRPLTFIFAVENRVPVLDYIDESVENDSYYYKYMMRMYGNGTNTTYNKTDQPPEPNNYNIAVDLNEEIEIFPFGIDPDDENLSYKYSGWKTPIFISNISGGVAKPYIDDHLPSVPPNIQTGSNVVGGTGIPENYWETSTYYTSGFNSSSQLHKDANNKTGQSEGTWFDVGYHWVRISVTDNEGLHDYQDVKIQVRCPSSHSCCDIANDYHWKECSSCCDGADGWPCIAGDCDPY